MRDYALWRSIGALFAASGAVAVVSTIVLPAPMASDDARGALAIYGIAAMIFGGVGALRAHTLVRVEDARQRHEDVEAAARGDPRRRGAALTVVGVVLLAIMGAVLSATVPQLLSPGRSIGGTRFSGTPDEARVILAIFAAVMAIGATAIGYGLWMWRTGRQNSRVAQAMMALWSLLIAIVALL